jgi:hypothetical protein
MHYGKCPYRLIHYLFNTRKVLNEKGYNVPLITFLTCNITTVVADPHHKSISKPDSAEENTNVIDSFSGEGSSSKEIETYESSPELYSADFTARPTTSGRVEVQGLFCTKLKVSGHCRWSYRNYVAAGYNKLTGSTDTSYANVFGSCGIPYPVDVIKVTGNTLPRFCMARIDKTAYNTSHVEQSDTMKWVDNGTKACGALVVHTAIHNGVTYTATSSSGCGN